MIAHAASNPQAKLLIPLEEEDDAAAYADSSKPLLSSIAEQGWKKKEICLHVRYYDGKSLRNNKIT